MVKPIKACSVMKHKLCLLSSSSRRKKLLEQIDLRFFVMNPTFDEDLVPLTLSPEEYVEMISLKKGEAFAKEDPSKWILTADTTTYIHNKIVNKPKDNEEAFEILFRAQGRSHNVFTAMTLFHEGKKLSHVQHNKVYFSPMHPKDIQIYLKKVNVLGAAGAYKAQGFGALFISKIEGTLDSVAGLTIHALPQLFESLGGSIWDFID